MPTTKHADATTTAANTGCFSLVPASAQQQMYRTLASLKPLNAAEASGAEIAEVAVCLAIGEQDPVILACPAQGARAVRKGSKFTGGRTPGRDGRFEAATLQAVAALFRDPKLTALVCGGRLDPSEDYRSSFSFAARQKLPILYLVANDFTPGRRQKLDLRSLYAEYGIPVFSVEANDAIAAYRVATEALHNARHHRGPCVIEALTIRGNGVSKTEALSLLQSYMQRHGNWPL